MMHYMKEILLRKSDELSGACRNYFEQLKTYLQQTKQSTFTNRLAGQNLRIAHSTIKRYHYELHNAGLIKLSRDNKKQQSGNRSYQYEISTAQEYETLKNRISSVLDEILEKIKPQEESKKELNGLKRLTNQTEPIKSNNSKAKKQRLNQPTGGYTDPKKKENENRENNSMNK